MENYQEIKEIISVAKNIYLIPTENTEGISSALALFYSLKKSGRNANLVLENIPENLKFLSPSLDFISYPKNFVVSIPNNVADVSQIYYEKNDNALKVHLTVEKGNIKKDNISFYFSEAKPDLIITLGIKDYSKELTERLDSFAFLLDSPILNIDSLPLNKNEQVDNTLADSVQINQKFGRINLIEEKPLSEIVFKIINNIEYSEVSKEMALCLLTGLTDYTKNFSTNITAEIFEMAGTLIKKGADLKTINSHIN